MPTTMVTSSTVEATTTTRTSNVNATSITADPLKSFSTSTYTSAPQISSPYTHGRSVGSAVGSIKASLGKPSTSTLILSPTAQPTPLSGLQFTTLSRLRTSSANQSLTAYVSSCRTPVPATTGSCTTAIPPAPTQLGVTTGCTSWHVATPGEYCFLVAQAAGITIETFFAWNPAVDPPNCPNLLAGYAYCVAVCGGIFSSILATSSPIDSVDITTSPSVSMVATMTTSFYSTFTVATQTSTSTTSTASSSIDVYRPYKGDGSVEEGWPEESMWLPFEQLFSTNQANMQAACSQWLVPNDTNAELSDMKIALQDIANMTGIDPRFILAIIIQESTGCVRVITTQYSVFNPGLMQSHNGTGTCNTNHAALGIPGVNSDGIVQYPCPMSEIRQMILDGTNGTSSGDGLVQIMQKQGSPGVMGYYRTARMYNGGRIEPSGDLNAGCCTLSYVSDIANRLTGWVDAPRNFSA